MKYICDNVGADLPHDGSRPALPVREVFFFYVFGGALRFLCPPARVEKVSAFPSGVRAHKRSIHFSWETVLFSVIGYYNHPAWKAAYDSSFPNPVPPPPFLWPERSHSPGTRNSRSKHFFSLRVEILKWLWLLQKLNCHQMYGLLFLFYLFSFSPFQAEPVHRGVSCSRSRLD